MVCGIQYAPQEKSVDPPGENPLSNEDTVISEYVARPPPLPDPPCEEHAPGQYDCSSQVAQFGTSIWAVAQACAETNDQPHEPDCCREEQDHRMASGEIDHTLPWTQVSVDVLARPHPFGRHRRKRVCPAWTWMGQSSHLSFLPHLTHLGESPCGCTLRLHCGDR